MSATNPLPETVQLVCTGTGKHERTTISTYRWSGPNGSRVTVSLAGNVAARQRAKLPAAGPRPVNHEEFNQGCGYEYPAGRGRCPERYEFNADRLVAAATRLRGEGVAEVDLGLLRSHLSKS